MKTKQTMIRIVRTFTSSFSLLGGICCAIVLQAVVTSILDGFQ